MVQLQEASRLVEIKEARHLKHTEAALPRRLVSDITTGVKVLRSISQTLFICMFLHIFMLSVAGRERLSV